MNAYLLPNEMTPEQRRSEIATILARSYLRLRSVPKDSAVNREEDLDEGSDKSVYAPTKRSTQ